MKRLCRSLVFAFPLMLLAPLASAQSVVDAAIGFGTAQSKASGLGVDSNTFDYCIIGSAATCQATPKLGGFFLGFGANFMLWEHFGVGMEAKLQPARQAYGVFDTRTSFYDFNGIWAPWRTKRAGLQLAGGLGGTNVSVSFTDRFCTGPLGCQSQNYAVGSSNHFQLHGGAGVQVYLNDSVFIRPQVDVHWVRNFHQFGRDTVPSYMVWLGYSFGSR